MSTTSEKTFGARLKNAFTIATVISTLPDYNTDLQELQPANFTAFLNSVAAANLQRTDAESAYTDAVADRQNVFRKDNLSIMKLLVPIKSSVQARYGKKSTEFDKITTAIKKMRSAKPVEYSKEDINDPNINIVVKVSQSHLSFGSITEAFTDLVQNIQSFPNYDSPRTELKLGALQAKVAQLNNLNRAVDATITSYKLQQKARLDNYALLSDRATKIKALLLSLYGKDSVAYTSVAKLAV